MAKAGQRKCLNCDDFFDPDPRNINRQRYCSNAGCRLSSKRASQTAWLAQSQNSDYFCGAPVHVQRVQAWRLAHPACSRAKPTRSAKGWIDQALVQWGLIDRLDARAAALYLFLVTVADAQGLSYYGAATLAKRLHLSEQELGGTRLQLIELDLIAYPAPLYQVLSLHEAAHTNRPAGHRA